jgi:hypothetical protein
LTLSRNSIAGPPYAVGGDQASGGPPLRRRRRAGGKRRLEIGTIMNAPIVARRPDGTVLPGSVLNPGGRPRTAIEELRTRLLPRLPEFVAGLIELTQSPNEATRLAALRE